MKSALILLALASACVASCAQAPVVATAAATAPLFYTIEGAVNQVNATAAKAYRLQTLYAPYELKRLDHIDVYLTNVTEPSVPAENKVGTLNYIGASAFSTDHTFPNVVLKNLKAGTLYHVRLAAFQLDPNQPATAAPIQVDDGTASNITSVDTDDASVTAGGSTDTISTTFSLSLKNQAFSGTASGAVVSTDGTLTTTGAETLAPAATTYHYGFVSSDTEHFVAGDTYTLHPATGANVSVTVDSLSEAEATAAAGTYELFHGTVDEGAFTLQAANDTGNFAPLGTGEFGLGIEVTDIE